MKLKSMAILMAAGVVSVAGAGTALAQTAQVNNMSFFVTSVGSGNGGNLGGLAGADAHCQALATAAGAGHRTWRAYLSTQAEGGRGESARQRIGSGPWYNAHGVLIAANAHDLHTNNTTISKYTAVDENGNLINGVGDSPNRHDILTGTMDDGMAYFPGVDDRTCSNWTSSGEGSATVGHHDRHGGGNTSWNSAHNSAGCSQQALVNTGGAGLFYCFAAD